MKNGEAAFIHKKGNDTYSASFKEKVVQDYLEGKGSFAEITVKYNGSTELPKNVGIYQITVDIAEKDNYEAKTNIVLGSYEITRKAATVTAQNKEKVYGQVDPELKATVEGLIGEDTIEYTLARESGENVGEYTITATGNVEQGNYAVSYNTGKLTIKPVTEEVVVTIAEKSGTYTYDATEKTVEGYEVKSISNPLYTIDNIVFNGNAKITGTDAGTYDMDIKEADFTNKNTNFENVKFVIEDGTLVINRKAVTVTADNKEVVYGDQEQELTYTVEEGALVGEDTKADLGITLKREEGSNVGTYAITAKEIVSTNYDVTVTPGVYTINRKQVTVTAQNKEKVYGQVDPELKATVEAMKNQFTNRKLTAVMELHTFSSLTKEFLSQYKGCMDLADNAAIYFNSHALELKRLPNLDKNLIYSCFAKEGLQVFTTKEEVEEFVINNSQNQENILMMSSGNFGGIDFKALSKKVFKN